MFGMPDHRLEKCEILDFIESKHQIYVWNFSTQAAVFWHKAHKLWSQCEVDNEDVNEAVRRKMDGPSQLLDYCSMQKKVTQHSIGS